MLLLLYSYFGFSLERRRQIPNRERKATYITKGVVLERYESNVARFESISDGVGPVRAQQTSPGF